MNRKYKDHVIFDKVGTVFCLFVAGAQDSILNKILTLKR
jgi:hypothetical protein